MAGSTAAASDWGERGGGGFRQYDLLLQARKQLSLALGCRTRFTGIRKVVMALIAYGCDEEANAGLLILSTVV